MPPLPYSSLAYPSGPYLFKNVVLGLVESDDLPRAVESEDISRCLVEGRLRPVVAESSPLEQIAEAHDRVEQGGQMGHVLLDIASHAVEW
jgi:NADPH2:quinone reductase